MSKKILILGVTGMLGHTLFTQLSQNRLIDLYGTVRSSQIPIFISGNIITNIDVSNFDSLVSIITNLKPEIIINCIGLIKQLPSANDHILAININSLLPHRLALLCKTVNAKLIHISTDCVFSGNKGNYIETDNPDPVDLYGRTKLLGEVHQSGCLTLRTSIIGREINSQYGLVEWFFSQKGKKVKGYAKAIYTGLTTNTLASIIEKLILEYPDLSGLWHLSSEPISKYQLLNIINKTFNLDINIEKDESYICDRSLNSQRFRKATNYQPPTWEEMIAQLNK